MQECMYAGIQVSKSTSLQVCIIHVCIYGHICKYTSKYVSICIKAKVNMQICKYESMHICVYAYFKNI